MAQIVEVPGQGNVEFPDGMSDQDIGRVIRLHVPEPDAKGSPEWAQWRNQRVHDLNDAATSPQKPDDQGFFHGLWQSINPFPAVKAVLGDPGGAEAGLAKVAGGAISAGVNQAGKAADAAAGKGEFSSMTPMERASSAVGHAAAAAVPLVGPAAAEAGEDIGEGRTAQGLGKATGLIGSVVAPTIIARAKSVPVAPALENPNPAVADAVKFGLNNDIPVDAGTATGNAFIKGAKHLADRTAGGSIVAIREAQSTADALTRTGRSMAADIHPSPVVPEQAGRGIQQAVEASSDASATSARAAYDKLAQIEADPANLKTIQIGTKTHDVMGQNGQSLLDAQGNPLSVDVPIMKDIALPVDMRPVKSALQPIYDQLSERMPPAQRELDPALNSIRNIINRPDYLPASVADKDLGYLKGIQRGAAGDQVKHFAGQAIDSLDQAVQDAVSNAGPGAVNALSRGRAATINKYAARDVLDNLRDEPVQTFNQALWKNDAGIDQLRAVQKFAPSEMPKLGRAYLDNLLDKATAEGDFGKQQGTWAQWQSLGPETKKIIFQDPAKIKALDNFFLLAKKLGENPNPSGTAHVASIGGQAVYTLMHPLTGIPMQIAGAALSKMLASPKVAQALTDGLRIPIGQKAASGLAATRILSLAGKNATPALSSPESAPSIPASITPQTAVPVANTVPPQQQVATPSPGQTVSASAETPPPNVPSVVQPAPAPIPQAAIPTPPVTPQGEANTLHTAKLEQDASAIAPPIVPPQVNPAVPGQVVNAAEPPVPAGSPGQSEKRVQIADKSVPEIKPVIAPSQEPAAESAPYKYSSTQVNLPHEFHKSFADAVSGIPDSELAADGRETEPHITALYGTHDSEPAAVKKLLAKQGPIEATIGKVSIFKTKDADVVKLDIDSPDMHALNGRLKTMEHTNDYPIYQPHMTLAYVKPGEGEKYVGKSIPGLTGKDVTFNRVMFSSKDQSKTDIPLKS